MTMDINNRKSESKTEIFKICDDRTTDLPPPVIKSKRPFDVAFLMLPDEKLVKKEMKLAKYSPPPPPLPPHHTTHYDDLQHANNSPGMQPNSHSEDEDEEIEVDIPHIPKFYPTPAAQKPQIFGDPLAGKPKTSLNENQKSAFTKVNLSKDNQRLSPNLSISPDLSYQNSLSPSPPIMVNRYQNILGPNNLFKTNAPSAAAVAYQSQFVQIQENSFEASQPFILKSPNPEILQQNYNKMRGMLPHAQYTALSGGGGGGGGVPRPDIAYNYAAQFPSTQEMLKPTAALLSSLLPPSLAALSLPAQNVCAKCNISFRMTSDLVYHMRSHHKNETTDYSRRKREEKLKCPVCAESFRERHHLTRHMTAHQDKDNDADIVSDSKAKKFHAFHTPAK